MIKMFKSRSFVGVMDCSILFSDVLPSVSGVVSAEQVKKENITQQEVKLPTPTGKEVLLSEINPMDIVLINGTAYDKEGNVVVEYHNQSLQRGKFSFVAKKLLASYNKWPGWVKGVVSYAAVKKFDKYLDKWSGNLSDGLTLAIAKTTFLNMQMSRAIANTLISLFV